MTKKTETRDPQKVLIIGAGPSGLVTAKYFLREETNYEVTLVESMTEIGGTFVNKVYDGTRLVSSQYITAFSDFRMQGKEDHPTTSEYVQYLHDYCTHFQLWDCIQFQTKVVSLQDAATSKNKNTTNTKEFDDDDDDDDSNGYLVTYEQTVTTNDDTTVIRTKEEHFDIVAVCSGLHNIPYIPKDAWKEKFNGTLLHSSQYKDASLFQGKRVLVLGCGETAMDICLRAIRTTESVALNARRGFLSIPHVLGEGRPLDVFITNFLEHAYEHPWIQHYRLRWWLSTVIIRCFLFLTGSSLGFNQWACPTTPIRRGYHIINKSHEAMAHLNVPLKKRNGWWGSFWMHAYGETHLRPIESFHRTSICDVQSDGRTVVFDDGRTYEADIIVMATGYRQSFPFLSEKIQQEFRQRDTNRNEKKTKFVVQQDSLPSQHFITSPNRPRLGFIGFVRPNVGAIPPMSELQVMWWLRRMKSQVQILPDPPSPSIRSYMLLGSKYPYGVDYGNYMHRLAEDMGTAPTLRALLWSSKPIQAFVTYTMGQAYISLFRIQRASSYYSDTSWKVVTEELWQVCLDRGFLENVGLFVVMLLSLIMNGMACLLEFVWCLLTCQRPKFFVRYA